MACRWTSPHRPQGRQRRTSEADAPYWLSQNHRDIEKELLNHVKKVFPHRKETTHFFPMLHFKRVPHHFLQFGGEHVRVIGDGIETGEVTPRQPKSRRKHAKLRKCYSFPVHVPVAGLVYVSNPDPSDLDESQIQASDVQDESTQQQVLHELEVFFKVHPQPMAVISNLNYQDYLCQTSKKTHKFKHAKHLPLTQCQGDFDLLFIHKHLGLIAGELKSIQKAQSHVLSPELFAQDIKKKVGKLIVQLDRAEFALMEWTGDLFVHGRGRVKITKVPFLPNITAHELKEALSSDPELGKKFRDCLKVRTEVDAIRRCFLSDTFGNIEAWWRHVLGTRNSPLDDKTYDHLYSRFCGPATVVKIPSVTIPFCVIHTLGHCVAETGLQFSILALYPPQLEALRSTESRVFLTGPPGTGKTVVLALKARQWLQEGKRVQIVSTQYRGKAVAMLLERQVKECSRQSVDVSRVSRHQYCFISDKGAVDRAVQELAECAEDGQLFIIADEVVYRDRHPFKDFCAKLKERVPDVHIWAASWRQTDIPDCFSNHVVDMRTMLRSPPVIYEEIKQSEFMSPGLVCDKYTEDIERHCPTKGPEIIWSRHRGQKGHSAGDFRDCKRCGTEIAKVLKEQLCIGKDQSAPEYRDVFIIYYNPDDEVVKEEGSALQLDSSPQGASAATSSSEVNVPAFVKGLQDSRIPVKVLKQNSSRQFYEDVALAKTNQVIVSNWENVSGLERRVVVGMGEVTDFERFYIMSRCTAQLIWILP